MSGYINMEAALLAIMNHGTDAGTIETILNMPAEDVAPVVHGEWICTNKMYDEYKCSACGAMDSGCSDYYSSHVVTEQYYCPNCGAKMDGGAK